MISDRQTDRQTEIVNYRVALTRLKRRRRADDEKKSFAVVREPRIYKNKKSLSRQLITLCLKIIVI